MGVPEVGAYSNQAQGLFDANHSLGMLGLHHPGVVLASLCGAYPLTLPVRAYSPTIGLQPPRMFSLYAPPCEPSRICAPWGYETPISPVSRAGLATIALAGVGAGIGIVFGSLIHSVSRNPSLSKQLFGYAILGFALSEAMALFALLVAFLILFGLIGFVVMNHLLLQALTAARRSPCQPLWGLPAHPAGLLVPPTF